MECAEKLPTSVDTPALAPLHWADSCTNSECSLHQLSPYIGKLKSVIARDLIQQYSKPGQLVVDMFCGSGTIPLEAACLGRRVFASDTSKYAVVLTKGKLSAPTNLEIAQNELDHLFELAESKAIPDLRRTPQWVRAFFHSRTLKETLRLTEVLINESHCFYLASLLGILHHQRPGFLSYPSSHLVPYLRSKNFPRSSHPELYEYRPVKPRLLAKIGRALKRQPGSPLLELVQGIQQSSAESLILPSDIDCVITSPPYMNALDYRRDNRLRLWFLNDICDEVKDDKYTTPSDFRFLIDGLAKQLNQKVKCGGYCVFIVGEQTFRGGGFFPSEILRESFLMHASKFRLYQVINDVIPDVRRSRKHAAGVKRENVLVFKKGWYA